MEGVRGNGVSVQVAVSVGVAYSVGVSDGNGEAGRVGVVEFPQAFRSRAITMGIKMRLFIVHIYQ